MIDSCQSSRIWLLEFRMNKVVEEENIATGQRMKD